MLIIGGGIVALALARELIAKGCDNILIIEKEPELAFHASGRNSGVLHAGIYYGTDSLKAQFCLSGSRQMINYCESQGLPVNRCGKVVVAKSESELATLNILYERAIANGATVDIIDEQQLSEIEPWAKTYQKALHVHDTAVVDPKRIMQSLYQELIASKKVRFLFNTQFMTVEKNNIAVTNQGRIQFKFLINAAGAYSDRIAHSFGVAKNLIMMPFKGIYRKLRDDQKYRVNGNIYPVPNIQNPFLGVHFTKNVHGDVYVGPTAIPAFGRENYGIFSGIDREAGSIILTSLQLFFSNPQFRQVALTEPRKYFSGYFYRCASELVKKCESGWLLSSQKCGIRPQLIDRETKKLMMDFVVEKTENSLHLLNLISPAFTSSMTMAKDTVNRYLAD